MANQYEHVGKPFTAKITVELILELCKGETLKRFAIRDKYIRHI